MKTRTHDHFAVDTMRYTRLMLLVIPLLMVVAIAVYAAINHRVEDSISSYYLGPARDLFVAMLVATAVLLVVYTGPPVEDFSLNLAGFYAIFVALVPTRFGDSLLLLEPAEQERAVLSIRVAVVAVMVVALAFVCLGWATNRWPRPDMWHNWLSKFLSVLCTIGLTGFLALLLWRCIEGTTFAGVHASAAFLLIFSMGVAIASHLARPQLCREDTSGGKGAQYGMLLILMACGLVAWPVLVWRGVSQAILIVEWFQIGIFSYFWYLESRRLWNQQPNTTTGPKHASGDSPGHAAGDR